MQEEPENAWSLLAPPYRYLLYTIGTHQEVFSPYCLTSLLKHFLLTWYKFPAFHAHQRLEDLHFDFHNKPVISRKSTPGAYYTLTYSHLHPFPLLLLLGPCYQSTTWLSIQC